MKEYEQWLVRYTVGNTEQECCAVGSNYIGHCLILCAHDVFPTTVQQNHGYLRINTDFGKRVLDEGFTRAMSFAQWLVG